MSGYIWATLFSTHILVYMSGSHSKYDLVCSGDLIRFNVAILHRCGKSGNAMSHPSLTLWSKCSFIPMGQGSLSSSNNSPWLSLIPLTHFTQSLSSAIPLPQSLNSSYRKQSGLFHLFTWSYGVMLSLSLLLSLSHLVRPFLTTNILLDLTVCFRRADRRGTMHDTFFLYGSWHRGKFRRI